MATTKKEQIVIIEDPEVAAVGPNDMKNIRRIILSDDKELVAYRQGAFGLWKLKYDHGMLSPKLKGEFTTFPKVLEEVKSYFILKGVTVVDVKD